MGYNVHDIFLKLTSNRKKLKNGKEIGFDLKL
jgi:hypothetical protein